MANILRDEQITVDEAVAYINEYNATHTEAANEYIAEALKEITDNGFIKQKILCGKKL